MLKRSTNIPIDQVLIEDDGSHLLIKTRMPQVDITLVFLIVQTFSILFFGAYFVFLFLLPTVVNLTKIKTKLNLFALHLTKLVNIRVKDLSVFNALKNLKLLDN